MSDAIVEIAVYIIGGGALVGAGIAGTALYFQIKTMTIQLDQSTDKIAELEQVTERRRHTHKHIEDIENAQAVIIDSLLESQALTARLDTALYHMGLVRQPNSKDKTPE